MSLSRSSRSNAAPSGRKCAGSRTCSGTKKSWSSSSTRPNRPTSIATPTRFTCGRWWMVNFLCLLWSVPERRTPVHMKRPWAEVIYSVVNCWNEEIVWGYIVDRLRETWPRLMALNIRNSLVFIGNAAADRLQFFNNAYLSSDPAFVRRLYVHGPEKLWHTYVHVELLGQHGPDYRFMVTFPSLRRHQTEIMENFDNFFLRGE